MANAFQQGQAAQLDLEKSELANEAAASTQAGINALADIFGETARTPREKVALETAASREEQRGIANVRQKRLDEVEAQRIETIRRARAGRQTVAFIKEGLKNGAAMEEIMPKVGLALQALGVTEEEIGQLPQMIAADPAILDQFEAVFRATEKNVARRAVGRPIDFRNAEGVVGTLQTFNVGPAEFTPGAATIASEQAEERVDISGRRVTVAEEKLDPEVRGAIKASEEAEKLTAGRLNEALPEARNAEVAISNTNRMIELADEGIRTGSFAGFRQEAARFMSDILGIPAEQIAATDETFARSGLATAEQIKSFGAGTGLSDADREFAAKIVGGLADMDIEAIKNLMQMQKLINTKRIMDYNRDRDAFTGDNKRLQKLYQRIPLDADDAAQVRRNLKAEEAAVGAEGVDALVDRWRTK